jgi:hypothetical protein
MAERWDSLAYGRKTEYKSGYFRAPNRNVEELRELSRQGRHETLMREMENAGKRKIVWGAPEETMENEDADGQEPVEDNTGDTITINDPDILPAVAAQSPADSDLKGLETGTLYDSSAQMLYGVDGLLGNNEVAADVTSSFGADIMHPKTLVADEDAWHAASDEYLVVNIAEAVNGVGEGATVNFDAVQAVETNDVQRRTSDESPVVNLAEDATPSLDEDVMGKSHNEAIDLDTQHCTSEESPEEHLTKDAANGLNEEVADKFEAEAVDTAAQHTDESHTVNLAEAATASLGEEVAVSSDAQAAETDEHKAIDESPVVEDATLGMEVVVGSDAAETDRDGQLGVSGEDPAVDLGNDPSEVGYTVDMIRNETLGELNGSGTIGSSDMTAQADPQDGESQTVASQPESAGDRAAEEPAEKSAPAKDNVPAS